MAAGKATQPTQLKITQVRGTIGTRWKQRESLRTLGLRKIRQSVVREDNAADPWAGRDRPAPRRGRAGRHCRGR